MDLCVTTYFFGALFPRPGPEGFPVLLGALAGLDPPPPLLPPPLLPPPLLPPPPWPLFPFDIAFLVLVGPESGCAFHCPAYR